MLLQIPPIQCWYDTNIYISQLSTDLIDNLDSGENGAAHTMRLMESVLIVDVNQIISYVTDDVTDHMTQENISIYSDKSEYVPT